MQYTQNKDTLTVHVIITDNNRLGILKQTWQRFSIHPDDAAPPHLYLLILVPINGQNLRNRTNLLLDINWTVGCVKHAYHPIFYTNF